MNSPKTLRILLAVLLVYVSTSISLGQGQTISPEVGMNSLLILGLITLLFIVVLTARSQRLVARNNRLLQKKNEEIRIKNKEIQNLGKSRNKWFVNIAHELKVPLTLVKGPLDQLKKSGKVGPEGEELLTIAGRNLGQLEKLISEIMDVSRLEEGALKLRPEPSDIISIAQDTLDYFLPLAQKKNIEILLEHGFQGPVHLNLDRDRVSKALNNLLSNAIKFTREDGKIVISIRDDGNSIVLAVKDNGVGISPSDLMYVFDRYFQAANSKGISDGTGVGLSLAKEIVELHGGEVKAQSELNVGSTFSFIFPHDLKVKGTSFQQSEEQVEPKEGEKPKPVLLGKVIYFADDNEDMRDYVKGFLSEKFSVQTFRDGKELITGIEKKAPDLIITDIMMPRTDGHAVIMRVKGDENLRKIPVIALTAVTEESEKLDILRLGVDDYLAKPFNSEELLIRIENLILNFGERGGSIEFEDVEEETSYADKLLQTLEEEVKSNISDANFNVIRLADAGSLSERQLYRYLKQTTGFTPANFIKEIRLQKAFELARRNVYTTTAELSYAVGFQHPSYFSTVFKERFGKKPSDMLKGE